MTIDFFMTSLIVALLPGTGVVFTISTAISGGLKNSFWAALGCTIGIVPHIIASLLGLAAIMNACAMIYNAIRYLGVVYLLYIAWKMWQNDDVIELNTNDVAIKKWLTIKEAVLINLLNPKLTLFFFAFLPQFISSNEANKMLRMIELSGIFMVLTFVVFIGYGYAASMLRIALISNKKIQRRMNQMFAIMLAIFGIRLAVSEK